MQSILLMLRDLSRFVLCWLRATLLFVWKGLNFKSFSLSTFMLLNLDDKITLETSAEYMINILR